MEKRKCKICQKESSDFNHIDQHAHNEIISYLYNKVDEKFYCQMCPSIKEKENKIKSHLFKEHDKEERFIQISKDCSGKYFTY